MAKTAAQLVPLKTQLSGSMSIFRFADAINDFAGSVAYQNFVYDNSGLQGAANGTAGSPAFVGTAVPSVLLTTPTTPSLTVNQSGAYTIATGLNRYQTQQYYHVAFYDSTYRESQAQVVFANVPSGTTTGSVTFSFNWPVGATGAVIYKPYNTSGFYAAVIPNSVTTYIDNTTYSGTLPAAAGVIILSPTSYNVAGFRQSTYTGPIPNGQSTAPTIGPATLTVTTSTTGGSFRSSGYGYGLTAYNAMGETITGAESTTANGSGVPWISGASSGVMNAVALTSSVATGTLPVSKWYYQVTAYTQNAAGVNGINNNGFTNSNGYVNLGSGAGYTESLPSTEVNVTTTGVGNVTLNWTPVANASGYAVYRSRDVPPPVQSAASTATTGGTLPATTAYYYVVTATNNNGETIASNEVTVTTGAGATNSNTLTWANVLGAYGYKVYRGTVAATENLLIGTITSGATVTFVDTGFTGTSATPPGANTATGVGQETYLTNLPGQAVPSYQDNGGTSTSQNSGFQPPKVYNGIYSAFTVQASWSAVTSAVGYYLYRNSSGSVGNQVNMSYFTTTGLTATDAGNQAGTKYTPQVNWTATPNITMVGRYLQSPNGSPYIDRLGFSVTLVPGQQYRFMIYNQTTQVHVYTGSYFTATSSLPQYYEVAPTLLLTAATYCFFYLEGQTYSSTISWGPNPKPSLIDNPTITILNENNTWVGQFTGNNNGQLNSGQQLGTVGRDGQVPTQVLTETTTGSLPMKATFRQSFSGTSINGVKGTMLGGPRVPQLAYSNNTAYSTPVKSIVPNWNVLVPANTLNPNLFAGRWVTVEVSTDAGVTYTALTNQTRYVFPTPVTQLQFRYTVPQNSMSMSFDRRIMTGLPATDNTPIASSSYNYYFTPDTPQVTGYYYQVQNRGDDLYMYSNGNMRFGNLYNNFQYNFWSIQGFSSDVDMQMQCYFNGAGNIGLRFRNDGSGNSYGGYYAYIDNAGNWGIHRTNYNNTIAATIASGSGATNGLLNLSHVIRVIAVGTHIQFFCDGIRLADVTDATGGSWLTGQNIGISGALGQAQSFQATALSVASLANSPQWELEYVSAYLET